LQSLEGQQTAGDFRMPDWFYRTISQRLLFRLPVPRGRDLAIHLMGTLARIPGGQTLIDFLGHQRPDARLSFTGWNEPLISRLGLGCLVDREQCALPAWTRFGFGYLEVGPIRIGQIQSGADRFEQNLADEYIDEVSAGAGLNWATLRKRCSEIGSNSQPLLLRLDLRSATQVDLENVLPELATLPTPVQAIAVLLSSTWTSAEFEQFQQLLDCAIQQRLKIFLIVSADQSVIEQSADLLSCSEVGLTGIVVESHPQHEKGIRYGAETYLPTLTAIEKWRKVLPQNSLIIAASGIHTPAQACQLLAAGADQLQLDTGLIFTGPSLVKRINQALLDQLPVPEQPPVERLTQSAWFWYLLIGISMFCGSMIALGIAFTKVLLSYDEQFLGMTAAQVQQINPRILLFLTHDRVTLAGVMIAAGILYASYAWYGIRHGKHWAESTMTWSCVIGGLSFLLFLGYGYLEPFHALATILLTQFLLMGLVTARSPRQPEASCLFNDWRWRWNLWGQLLAIVHSLALILAGLLMCWIGTTSVFVKEDLHFMVTTPEILANANPRLIPLIAHDRVTLGGMLLATGTTFLLPALWANTHRARWFWIATTLAGLAGYIPAIIVHYQVGYIDMWHLAPAYLGLNYFILQQGLSWPYQWGYNAVKVAALHK
jgi:dihydroorotate dehydrogenase